MAHRKDAEQRRAYLVFVAHIKVELETRLFQHLALRRIPYECLTYDDTGTWYVLRCVYNECVEVREMGLTLVDNDDTALWRTQQQQQSGSGVLVTLQNT